MSDLPRRSTLEFKQSDRQHLDNSSATLYNRTTMLHGKTSRLLNLLNLPHHRNISVPKRRFNWVSLRDADGTWGGSIIWIGFTEQRDICE
ncbi:hypothetical protein KQX54_017277 [Cotesia glomerata]|uniref:Uncharacterized protein n=1 Tax=Cotesia glomerata TaxID=32391 RepID=A0AAV7HSI2_COTGL|nr:hypothetical protein KQX54_017277 [Cotesia glomerata]